MGKDLLTITDLSKKEIKDLLEEAHTLKKKTKRGIPYRPLIGKTLGMLFEKPSTRTRISFQAGMYQLGGEVVFMSPKELQLGRGETIADTARVLSRYLDILALRTFSHSTIEEFAKYSSIPVINALSDLYHPCQVLADLLTIKEKFGHYKGLKVAFVGDGNNVANSWINLATRIEIELDIATPEGYEPVKEVVRRARAGGAKVKIGHEPVNAVRAAQVVYTDVWVSMGQDAEREERLKAFGPFQVTPEMMKMADSGAIFMHCLPAHRGEEVKEGVIDGPRSVVWDQAENRLHLQKALMIRLLEQL